MARDFSHVGFHLRIDGSLRNSQTKSKSAEFLGNFLTSLGKRIEDER